MEKTKQKNLEIPANEMHPDTHVYKLCLVLFSLLIISLRL